MRELVFLYIGDETYYTKRFNKPLILTSPATLAISSLFSLLPLGPHVVVTEGKGGG